MGIRLAQANFSKGVLSERLIRRVDVESYAAGLRRGDNIIVRREGGFTIRPGFRYFDETLDDGEMFFPFTFSNEQTYALAMGQGYMQPTAYGGFILETEFAIAGATKANPCVLNVALHGYAVGDRVFIPAGAVTGMTQLNGRVWTVTAVPDADHIAINANSTAWGTFTGSTGGVTNVAPPPPPPPPPPVPPPVPAPDPPIVGGGGGGGGTRCVADDTMILLADGSETPVRLLHVGMAVRTQNPDRGFEWGAYRVEEVSFSDNHQLYAYRSGGRTLFGTALHRVYVGGEWTTMQRVGKRSKRGTVAQVTISGARTYVSNGVLSHNLKMDPDNL
jgi:hypothetical protein